MSIGLATGFIGLGAMGTHMAHNLYQAGDLAAVWNRSRQRLDAFVRAHPVAAADSPAAVAERARVVITCVSADDDLLEVIDQLAPGLRQGAVVVDCSTVSRSAARAAAERVAAQGTGFLDAPVSGGVEGARKGSLAIAHIYLQGQRPAVLKLGLFQVDELLKNLRELHCRWAVVS